MIAAGMRFSIFPWGRKKPEVRESPLTCRHLRFERTTRQNGKRENAKNAENLTKAKNENIVDNCREMLPKLVPRICTSKTARPNFDAFRK